MHDPMERLAEQLGFDVSRETLGRLRTHNDLLKKWNRTINLVAHSTLAEGWTRHIIDSAQVFLATDRTSGTWLDIGTGGGFPGVVCAIIAAERAPDITFTLVESDQRKCAFLATILRETGLEGRIKTQRIESLPPQSADIISARAVAPLPQLLEYASPHLSDRGHCIFPKGESYPKEIETAQEAWCFKWHANPSITDPKAVILVLGEIERV